MLTTKHEINNIEKDEVIQKAIYEYYIKRVELYLDKERVFNVNEKETYLQEANQAVKAMNRNTITKILETLDTKGTIDRSLLAESFKNIAMGSKTNNLSNPCCEVMSDKYPIISSSVLSKKHGW